MSKENLIEILESRKKYITENYSDDDKEIALFEINTLLKCVDKAYSDLGTPVRIRRKPVKGLFN